MLFRRQNHLSSHQQQRLQRRRSLLAGVLLIALLVGAFFLGERSAYRGLRLNPEMYVAMKAEVPRLQARVAELEAQLDVERTQAQVDKQALEMVRREIAVQKEQIAGLVEGLGFYRSLMAPGEIAQGLSLRPLELVAQDDGEYGFRIVAQQEARKHALLKVDLFAELVGVRAGERVSYSLAELSDDVDSNPIPLRFRYFQSVEGTLSLPENFEPRSVRLLAKTASPREMEAQEEFPWQVKEKFTHVGK
ncbi:hypothetical protein F0M18_11180 [Pseudohalioglobus sediminis]|uniref:Uncharacterized protein n=1 Tax=Pseudohalioglobus sediminis TaxID=2606449 RepID=A0A5B0X0E6_9GAMM|nr:DUF6776 family protein [Pseudohalioglobus sediminis]KAA1192068.1 hypothetical protein F0M18_11180 [Pseudohalioglobus sediminis]